MSFVSERSNNSNTIRYYSITPWWDDLEALKWIYNIKNIPGITTKDLYFQDSVSRYDDGSESIHIDPNAEFESVSTTLKKRSIDDILLCGKYHDKPIVIGVKLREHLAYITIRKNNPADYEDLERQLNLL